MFGLRDWTLLVEVDDFRRAGNRVFARRSYAPPGDH
ncbi:hypothetical protein A2U01_0107007, partial [Trifolium medium]|nr:hypothetical protein [Trifolium medium]